MKICIIIRVYDRVEDLLYNIKIIRDTWKSHDYEIVVVFNGESDGYILPLEVDILADKTIKIPKNAGHLKGNSQLLLEGFKSIDPQIFDFLIILESDTWLYTDKIINKYTNLLNANKAVWASARWYDRFYSLATDFAIIKMSFLKENTSILDFTTYPECYVCNYLLDRGLKYILIKENMNVQIPGYLKKFPYAPCGRFYSYPKSSMVTHHIEDIKGGMNRKKKDFNIVAKYPYFNSTYCKHLRLEYFKMRCIHFVDKLLLRRTWYSKREKFNFKKTY